MDFHTITLQQHRTITFKQLDDITLTINRIDALSSGDSLTNPTYTVNDKVISLSAPNKDRIGLVTKVTPNFIHITPINNRFPSFKKTTENLAHFTLLQQHRAIAVKQLHDITSTIIGINELLSENPLKNSTIYTVNDKVISLSSPNKDRIGLVTKVTPNFVHVTPTNTKFTPFKKSIENLAHFPLRGNQTILDNDSPPANISPEKLPPSNTLSSAAPKAHTTLSTPPSSPDTSITTLSLSSTPSTPQRTSPRRLILPTQSTISATTGSRYRHRLNPTRQTSLARTARCARSDTRPTQRKRTKR